MSLGTLVQSLRRGELLLPVLREFLFTRNAELDGKGGKDKEGVMQDARLTIATFKERLSEYNHGLKLDGDYFHPSQIGRCLRALWFDEKKAPRQHLHEDLFRQHMTFETGTYVGVLFQNLCERAGVLEKREAPIIDKKLKMIGHADGIVTPKKSRAVLEIKTINSRGFTALVNAPKKEHVQQTHCYMKGLDIDLGVIVYLEKDRHTAREFVVPFSPKLYETEVRQRIDHYFDCVHSNALPEREGSSPTEAPCCWCPYARVCFGSSDLSTFMKSLARKCPTKVRFH